MASRRKLVQGALFLGGAWALMARPWTWGRGPALEFSAMEGLAPFRRLAGGEVSLGPTGAIFVGLDGPEGQASRADPARAERLRDDLRAVMWGGWTGGKPVPVSYFTDIRCPVCRLLEARLEELSGIALSTREYPVFGTTSALAARAILAAARQGRGEVLRALLKRAPITFDRAYLETAIGGLGLDRQAFFGDLDGPAVAERLAEDRALARLFDLPGTPGLVIGRSVVVGLQPSDVLEAIVAEEARMGAG